MKRLGNNCWKTRRARLSGRTRTPRVRCYRLMNGWTRYKLKSCVVDVGPLPDFTLYDYGGVVTFFDYPDNEPKP